VSQLTCRAGPKQCVSLSTLSPTLSLSLSLLLSLSFSLSLRLSIPPSFSLYLSRSHCFSIPLFLCLSVSLSRSLSRSLALALSLSLSLSSLIICNHLIIVTCSLRNLILWMAFVLKMSNSMFREMKPKGCEEEEEDWNDDIADSSRSWLIIIVLPDYFLEIPLKKSIIHFLHKKFLNSPSTFF
jgi:hypothetical protein